MRLVVQRVSEASVVSDGVLTGRIGRGLMILCGVGPSDNEEAAKLLAKKVAELRVFSDKDGKNEPERERPQRRSFRGKSVHALR